MTCPTTRTDAASTPLRIVVTFPGETVAAVLERARSLIRNRRDWVHDTPGETGAGRVIAEPALVRHHATRRSLLGAIEAATADITLQWLCTRLLERAVADATDGYLSLQHLAYHEGYDAALGALTDAIELARAGDHPVAVAEEFLPWHRPPTRDEYLDLCGELQSIGMWFTASDRYSGMFNATPSMRRQTADRERAIEAYIACHKDRLPPDEDLPSAGADDHRPVIPEPVGVPAGDDEIPF